MMQMIKRLIKRAITSPIELLLLLLLLGLHILFLYSYRPYAYAHGIGKSSGFSLANNYPSISAVVITYLFLHIFSSAQIINSRSKRLCLLGCVLIAEYLYECSELLWGKTCDWYDMLGITIGGIIVLPFLFKKENHHKFYSYHKYVNN